MIPENYNYYIDLHEKSCTECHLYELEPWRRRYRRHIQFIWGSKLECLKHVLSLIPSKEEYNDYFINLLHTIIGSNNIEKIEYFFHCENGKFVQPIKDDPILNERLTWEYSKYKLDDPSDFLDSAIRNYHFNFVKKAIKDWNIKISYFPNFARYLVMCSIGYTHHYYGFEGEPGDLNVFKEFYDIEAWKYSDNPNAKDMMIDEFVRDLNRCYVYEFLDPIDLNDEWWIRFVNDNKYRFLRYRKLLKKLKDYNFDFSI